MPTTNFTQEFTITVSISDGAANPLVGTKIFTSQHSNSILEATSGDDNFTGTAKNDAVSYASATGPISVSLNIDTAQNTVGSGWDKFTSIENVRGSHFDDTLIGNAVNNWLTGCAGNDHLAGGDGNDVLIGGYGKDTLNGGNGKDIFRFITKDSYDTIVDFDSGSDIIQLENATFKSLKVAGALDNTHFAEGTEALNADQFIIFERNTGAVFYDADGNGAAAIQIVKVATGTTLTNDDFIII